VGSGGAAKRVKPKKIRSKVKISPIKNKVKPATMPFKMDKTATSVGLAELEVMDQGTPAIVPSGELLEAATRFYTAASDSEVRRLADPTGVRVPSSVHWAPPAPSACAQSIMCSPQPLPFAPKHHVPPHSILRLG
jgi:hypothetical protein